MLIKASLFYYRISFIIMNTEKEITFSELRGKFTKDFDTFGKMVKMFTVRIPSLSSLWASVLQGLKRQMVQIV